MATLAKFGLHAVSWNSKQQIEEKISIHKTIWIILSVYFPILHVQQKCTDNIVKIYKECNSQPRLGCPCL
jgi:hypothetical protein